MSGGSTYQSKPVNRPGGLSQYVYKNFCYHTIQWLWLWGCVCDDWKPSFLTGIIFHWRTLSRQVTVCFGHVGEQKIRTNHSELPKTNSPIRTREIAGVRLSEKELYAMSMGSGTNYVVSVWEENMLYTKN